MNPIELLLYAAATKLAYTQPSRTKEVWDAFMIMHRKYWGLQAS